MLYCIVLEHFGHCLKDCGFAVRGPFVEFEWEAVERAVSVAFHCSFCLPVCLFVHFNIKVAWYPSDCDTKVAEPFFGSGELGM